MTGILLTSFGCRHKASSVDQLPLPPIEDSGILNGQYFQTDYGYGFPVPAKCFQVRLSDDQEVDEVMRFSDASLTFLVRVGVQNLPLGQEFSDKTWEESLEQDFQTRQIQVLRKGDEKEWKTDADEGKWTVFSWETADPSRKQWHEEEWGLPRQDFLVTVHATLPEAEWRTDKGQRLFKALQDSLTQIRWYMPVGPRGISQDRYELEQFTQSFCSALESGSLNTTAPYFDEMYPAIPEWNLWYQKLTAADGPQGFDLKAELSGLVINGDKATATFTVLKTDRKSGALPQKFQKDFQMSKDQGVWKIVAPIGHAL